jgi:head-tail adaptor
MALKLHAGILDRIVTILVPAKAVNAHFGTRDTSWTEGPIIRAQVRDVLPSRGGDLADGVEIQANPARVRFRYRTDVTQSSRLRIDGEDYRVIAGPAEIGERRRTWMEVMVERYSTEGETP